MARNNRGRRHVASPELSDGSQNSHEHNPQTAPRPPTHPSVRRARRNVNNADVGEEFDLTLPDEQSSGPSQPNSQTAPPLRPQASTSRPTTTAATSRSGTQQTTHDIKHYFRKTQGESTVCINCE